MPTLWMIRSGRNAELIDEFIGDCHASVGYGVRFDVTGLQTQQQFREACGTANPDPESEKSLSAWAGNIRRFVVDVNIGDYVITQAVDTGSEKTYRFGVVVTEAYFAEEDDNFHHHTRRRVHWDSLALQATELSAALLSSMSARLTVFSLDDHTDEFFGVIGRPSLAAHLDNSGIQSSSNRAHAPYRLRLSASGSYGDEAPEAQLRRKKRLGNLRRIFEIWPRR